MHSGSFLVEGAAPEGVFIPEEFDADSRLMGQTASEFLRREVLPLTEQIEAHDTELMHRLMQKAGALGLLGADIPEVYGGLGLDTRTGALLAEKINWQQSFALTHEAHTVIATLPLLFFGNDSQKSRYLPRLASGEWIGAFCLSESGSGSDALGAQTRADLDADGSHYILNGSKMWITNTAFADLFTVFANIDGDKFTTFLVERGYPGLSFGKEENKLGMRGTSTRRVILENVPVPVENLVGQPGKGHYAAFCALNMGRFKLEAGAVGGLKETLAACARYGSQRKQFGRPIAEFGLIQAKLGEMAARTFGLESSVYRLAGLLDGVFKPIVPDADDAPLNYHRAAEEYALECCIVKVIGSELYSWATDEAIQIHGGNGYTEEFPVARAWRDQRLLRIGEGANEIVRMAIVTIVLRRAQQGRLDMESALKAAKDWTRHARRAQDPCEAPRRLAAAGVLLLECARDRFGDELMEEQEVAAVIADLISAAYVAESAWIRAEKLAERGSGRTAELARDAALLYGVEALRSARSRVEEALMKVELDAESQEGVIQCLSTPDGTDTIGIRRRLARAALEHEGWPWG